MLHLRLEIVSIIFLILSIAIDLGIAVSSLLNDKITTSIVFFVCSALLLFSLVFRLKGLKKK